MGLSEAEKGNGRDERDKNKPSNYQRLWKTCLRFETNHNNKDCSRLKRFVNKSNVTRDVKTADQTKPNKAKVHLT